MPQLNPEFFVSQLFWLVVTFLFLLVFLWRISLPRIGFGLEKPEKKINDDIAAAKELQEKAETIQKILEDKLRNTRTETDEMIKTTSINLQEKTAKELIKLDKNLDKKIHDSANDIEKNKRIAPKNFVLEVIGKELGADLERLYDLAGKSRDTIPPDIFILLKYIYFLNLSHKK